MDRTTTPDAPDTSERDPCNPESEQATTPAQLSDVDAVLRSVLADVLGLDAGQVAAFDDESGLFGELPELDSMAVAGLLTELEDRLDIIIEDDEVDGEMLETFGGLRSYAEAKCAKD